MTAVRSLLAAVLWGILWGILIKGYEPNPWSWTRFDLFYSAVGRYWASQVHFLDAKVIILF